MEVYQLLSEKRQLKMPGIPVEASLWDPFSSGANAFWISAIESAKMVKSLGFLLSLSVE